MGTDLPVTGPTPVGDPYAPPRSESETLVIGMPIWARRFYDSDFDFQPAPGQRALGERLKRLPLAPQRARIPLFRDLRLSAGGEFRQRPMGERNHLPPGQPGQNNFDLLRWRQYVEVNSSDRFRVFAEMIDASFHGGSQPPISIDVNRWDLFEGYVDIKLGEREQTPMYARVGRQILAYGSQRLVSPSMWSNAPRRFEGLKFYTHGETWDLDAFLVHPVQVQPVSFDSIQTSDTFAGVWGVYKGIDRALIDLYWLWNDASSAPAGHVGGNRHTVASRWLFDWPAAGDWRRYHVDVEGGYQFGADLGRSVQAGFFTGGLGHSWAKLPWQPHLWGYVDWASGGRGGNTIHTFDQLFPWGHNYLGLFDNIGRQNIVDLHTRLSVVPARKLDASVAYHWFYLASTNDVLYSTSGAPIGAPGTGRYVGSELDLVATCQLRPNLQVQGGYFVFFAGEFVQRNTPRGTGNLLYVQTSLEY